ncbi:MAG: magnesium/cobalt transporter CorA [Ignavibacteria bacterium]|nr:magnesium/cobalt transporter CorA [Ignavibacteria bacterium]
MSRRKKRISTKTGLAPGSLVYIGENEGEEMKFFLFDYDETNLIERETTNVSDCIALKEKPTITWINIDGINRPDVLEKLGNSYGLHPLVMEDILNTEQRPKLESYNDYLYIVLKMLTYSETSKEIIPEQVSIVLGKNFVLSFQEGIEGDVFNPVRERIRMGKGIIRKQNADFLVYALLDIIVDNYFIILEKLEEQIEILEEELTENPTPTTLSTIHRLRRNMIYLLKNIWPLREVINNMQREESSLIKTSTSIYLRDVYDHTIRVVESIESFREILTGMLDIYLSSINNKMNAVMKVLTIITTIFMPLSFIAGVYGMNFKFMPELEWQWGYITVLSVMLSIGGMMLLYFRKKDWL